MKYQQNTLYFFFTRDICYEIQEYDKKRLTFYIFISNNPFAIIHVLLVDFSEKN